MTTVYDDQRLESGVFDFGTSDTRKDHKARRKEIRQLQRQLRRIKDDESQELGDFPVRQWGYGGPARKRSARGMGNIKLKGIRTTTHTAATAYPFVSGPALGAAGMYIGEDRNGGGAFAFDPWSLYDQDIISGMSAVIFGQVGTGKSSTAKAYAVRSVQAGRKLSVASDKKGEWTPIVQALGGSVIRVGPGMPDRINPLDTGTRPSLNALGKPLGDAEWQLRVRSRRLSIVNTMVRLLIKRDIYPGETHAISTALDNAVIAATREDRPLVIPDVITQLEALKAHDPDALVRDGAAIARLALSRLTSGDLGGMFDGPTTVSFDHDDPAVSIDTSSLKGVNRDAAHVVHACTGAWTEAMVTTSDGGQRIVVYEEGWDNINSEADLQRMVEAWKLARAYGIFNILIMHKIADLDMAGDQGSQMAAMARSLLTDSDVKIIHRQDETALRTTMDEIELSDREEHMLKNLPKGVALWRVRNSTFEVKTKLTEAEMPLFDTDERMDKAEAEEDDTVKEPVAL
ncbi:MAG: conjugal transfer protein TraC [Micrococcaceae bacterium]|nr:conjugal transfer protein TraC [Micrococcaceae bacterium]